MALDIWVSIDAFVDVALISSATSAQESVFLDASESGGDVFFLTSGQLVPLDTDTGLDVYDARVDGGFPAEPPPGPPVCEGDACQGTPTPQPVFGTPASVTFNGSGNLTPVTAPVVKPKPLTNAQKLAKALKACRKRHNKHKRLSCEKQARKKYGRKSSSQRRHK
jgi:hypothetical protein